MNLLQIMRKARFGVDAIRANNAVSALWSDEELADLVNTAMDKAAQIIRLADSRILSKTLASNSAVAYSGGSYGAGSYGSEDLISEVYNMFQVTAEVTDYVLPPDLARVVSIRPVDVQFQAVVFRPMNTQDKYFLDQRSIPSADLISSSNSNQTFWYTLVGSRGIRFTPTPKDNINIELVYDFRPPKVFYSTLGSVTIFSGSDGLSGNASDWLTKGIRPPAELVVGADAVNSVRINQYYPTILGIASDSAAQMTRPWQTGSVVTSAYGLAMVPALPPEHHAWLADMTSAMMMRKVNADTSEKMMLALEKQLKDLVQPEITVRQIQESIPVEPFETHRM